MPSTIQFANAAQLEAFLQFYQQYYAAAQTGATPVDIAVGLQFVDTGGKLVAGQISNAQMQGLISSGQVTLDTTAAQAFQQYLTAGGATSTSLAATSSAANEIVANGAIATTSTGAKVVGMLSMNLPTVAAAIAPLAGVAIGAGLYSANPELWEKISRALLPFCYDDTELMPVVVDENGDTYYPQEAIEAVKGVLSSDGGSNIVTDTTSSVAETVSGYVIDPFPYTSYNTSECTTIRNWATGTDTKRYRASGSSKLLLEKHNGNNGCQVSFCSTTPFTVIRQDTYVPNDGSAPTITETDVEVKFQTINDKPVYFTVDSNNTRYVSPSQYNVHFDRTGTWENVTANLCYLVLYGSSEVTPEGLSEWKGVQYPANAESIGIVTKIDGENVTTQPYLPISTPIGEPGVSVTPDEAPDLTTNKDKELAIDPWIPPNPPATSYPQGVSQSPPSTVIDPVPAENPVLDPNADPSKIPPVKPPTTTVTNPTPPVNTGTSPTPQIPIIPVLPSAATGLLHVYNPTQSQLDMFGSWLWTTFSGDLIDTLSKLFNNPMDAVIGLHELYATPAVSGSSTIRAGYLDSNVPSNVVGNRYTAINCGSIVVQEYYQNYLDYSPYTKCYIYLPFVGIVPVLADDIIGNAVNVTYHIDSYTGCCIAVVTVAREGYSSTVYQFEGNCAVEIPITSGYQSTLMGALIGIGATALTGNPHAGIAAANLGRASLGKNDVSHSGSFGSSYGAMGAKSPYIIVKHPTQKSVVNYNQDYGFPAHKRVTIGACSGYLRAREVHVISPSATDEEKARIEELLKSGVFVK